MTKGSTLLEIIRGIAGVTNAIGSDLQDVQAEWNSTGLGLRFTVQHDLLGKIGDASAQQAIAEIAPDP